MATKDSLKFGTLIWFIAGLIIPLWPISLPVCWYLAYRSYKSGDDPVGKFSDLQAATVLHKQGIISDAEFTRVKQKTTGIIKVVEAAPNTGESEKIDEKWDLLVKFDDEIKVIVNDLSKYGAEAITQLAKAHMAVNDKSKLPAIAEKIKQDIEQEFANKISKRIAECNVFKFENGMIYGLNTPLQFFVFEHSGSKSFDSLSEMENGILLTKKRERIFGTERENLIQQNAEKIRELILWNKI
jgi:hypothetical protein